MLQLPQRSPHFRRQTIVLGLAEVQVLQSLWKVQVAIQVDWAFQVDGDEVCCGAAGVVIATGRSNLAKDR